MKKLIPFLTLLFALTACDQQVCCVPDPNEFDANTDILIDQDNYDSILAKLENNETASDPFELDSVVVIDGYLNLVVSYSGGCEEHDFTLIWSEEMSQQNPPQVRAILVHEDNGDLCEAYPTEILEFDLANNPFGYTAEMMSGLCIIITNGSNAEEIVATK